MSGTASSYYVPEQSRWPIVGSIGLFFTAIGIVNWIHGSALGPYGLMLGAAVIIYMMYGWFGHVIEESMSGLYSEQLDRSFRYGMGWFIFSEVMFFAAFFGALFYVTLFTLPWLGGLGAKGITGQVLWPDFKAMWPLLHHPDPSWDSAKGVIPAWGVPALNTAILLTSGATITWAHWALKKEKRSQLNIAMAATVVLGVIFLYFQAHEYHEAYTELGLTLGSGIYGTTFFMLTGFHGMHVTIGTIMLITILVRCMKGHFTPESHFAFEAVAWYWHFVDVVWLFLFICVYWRPEAFFFS